MAYSDPQSVTINAISTPLPRTSSGLHSGEFTSADGNVKLTVSHTGKGKRTRHLVRLDIAKVAADPLIAAQNLRYTMSVQLVTDVPLVGYTVTEQKNVVKALTDWLSASTDANNIRLAGGEN